MYFLHILYLFVMCYLWTLMDVFIYYVSFVNIYVYSKSISLPGYSNARF